MNRYNLKPSPSAAKEQRKRDHIHAFEQLSWAEDKIIDLCQKRLGVNVISGTFCYVRSLGQVLVRFAVAAIDDSFSIRPTVHIELSDCENDEFIVDYIGEQINKQIAKSEQPSEYQQAINRIRAEMDKIRIVQDQGRTEKEELLTRWLR